MVTRFAIVLSVMALTCSIVAAAGTKRATSTPRTAGGKQTQGEKRDENRAVLPVEPVSPALFLLRDPMVQQELKLTDRQITAAGVLAVDFNEQIWRFRDASVDSEVALREAHSVNSQIEPRLAEFLDAKQRARLDSIVLQVQGTDALSYSSMVEKLSLTADQQAKIAKLTAAARETMSKLQSQSAKGKDLAELNRQDATLQTGLQRDLQGVLTKPQRDRWIDLRGASIDISRLQPLTARAPELRGVTTWLNSKPLMIEQLRGKVVVLHFWTFG